MTTTLTAAQALANLRALQTEDHPFDAYGLSKPQVTKSLVVGEAIAYGTHSSRGIRQRSIADDFATGTLLSLEPHEARWDYSGPEGAYVQVPTTKSWTNGNVGFLVRNEQGQHVVVKKIYGPAMFAQAYRDATLAYNEAQRREQEERKDAELGAKEQVLDALAARGITQVHPHATGTTNIAISVADMAALLALGTPTVRYDADDIRRTVEALTGSEGVAADVLDALLPSGILTVEVEG